MSNLFGQTMTIKEVANVLGVDVDTIHHHVRNLYPDLMSHGKTTRLDQIQVTEIKKKMQLTNALVSSKTELEIIRGGFEYIQWMQSKIVELEKQKEEDLPKIEFHDAVANVEGKRKVGDASKELKLLSPNKLFAQLRNDQILMKDNLPYQEFIERGYFEVNVTLKNDQTYSTTYVTNKGMIWLEKKYKNLIGLK